MQYSVNVDRNSMAMQVSRTECEGFWDVLYSHCSGEERWWMLWKVRGGCDEEGTECEDGDSDTDWWRYE